MHPVPFAVLPVPAVITQSFFHPAAVPVWLETIVPDIDEIILVDITLHIV
jgi:hypothetical protein